MNISEDKHTLTFRSGDGESANTMFVTYNLVNNAPPPFKEVTQDLLRACAFIEQFGLSGHFIPCKYNKEAAISCQSILPIELDIKSVLGGDDSEIKKVSIAPSMSFCVYTGLRNILKHPVQLMQPPDKMTVYDSSDLVGWDDHKVFYTCFAKSEYDITTSIFIFKEDPDVCLRLVGSYSSFEDKLFTEEGRELDAPQSVKEKLRSLYGKEELDKQIMDIIKHKEGD